MLRTALMILALALAPAIASANAYERSIVSQLRAQGYSNIEVSRTFLGRGRITAQSDTLNREIVFNPATGAILRDFARQRDRIDLIDPGAASPGRGGFGAGLGSGDDGDNGNGDGDNGDNGDADGGDGNGNGDGNGDGNGNGNGDGNGDGNGGGDD